MGVPAHDERDFEFAKKYGLPIKPVIDVAGRTYSAGRLGAVVRRARPLRQFREPTTASSSRPPSMRSRPTSRALGLGEKQTTWRLRDWGISRQRYWGCPIPVIHCERSAARCRCPTQRSAGAAAGGSRARRQRQSAAARTPRFSHVHLPALRRRRPGARPTPWTPSWTPPGISCALPAATTHEAMLDARVHYWLPVDQYIGGIEHAILHLLYSRFWTRVVQRAGCGDLQGAVRATCSRQGMVLNEVFFRKPDIRPHRVFQSRRRRGARSTIDGHRRASRCCAPTARKSNRAASSPCRNPRTTASIRRRWSTNSAPTRRGLFTMFAAPPEQTLEWSDEGVQGAFRFIKRLWKAVHEHVSAGAAAAARQERTDRGAARHPPSRAPDPGEGHRRHRPAPDLQHGDRRGHGAAERRREAPAERRRPTAGSFKRRSTSRCWRCRPSSRTSPTRCGASWDTARPSSTSAGRRSTPPRSIRPASRWSCR